MGRSWWRKQGACGGKTTRGQGTKLLAGADRAGLPFAVPAEAARPPAVKVVHATRTQRCTRQQPQRLSDDRDPVDEALARDGSEMIAPHEATRKQAAAQDGRVLRRYRRRGKVERLCAWVQSCRRLVVRYEYPAENFLGFVHLGCLGILLRSYL